MDQKYRSITLNSNKGNIENDLFKTLSCIKRKTEKRLTVFSICGNH